MLLVTTAYAAVPDANFSGIPRYGTVPLTVSFNDLSSGAPAGWAWYFGDETYQNPWSLVNASSPWAERDSPAVAIFPDGTIVLAGGGTDAGVVNDTWRSTDSGKTWTRVNASSGWLARTAHRCVVMPDGTLVLFGGVTKINDNFIHLNDVWQSHDRGVTWECVNTSAGWTPRGWMAVVVSDNRIITTGGTLYGGFTQYSDVWSSADNGVTWTRLTPAAEWGRRYGHSMVVMPNRGLVLFGGYRFNYGFLNDIWYSGDDGASWVQMNTTAGWEARHEQCSVVLPDGSISLMGGHNHHGSTEMYYNDTWVSIDDGVTWTRTNASAGWESRYVAGCGVMPDGSVLLIGGTNDAQRMHDVWQFQPAGSLARNPVHVFRDGKNFTVTLQVSGDGGYNRTQKTGYILAFPNGTPFIDSVVPNSGKQGTLINLSHLSGAGFRTRAKVFLVKAGAPAINATNVTVVSPTRIICSFTVPLHDPVGYWNLRVVNPNGNTSTKMNAFLVRSPVRPTVTNITPASAVQNSVIQVSYLAGSGFALIPKPTVQLVKNTTTINATNITVINPNRMTCTFRIPSTAAAGSWAVKVINADGQSGIKMNAFVIRKPPAITGISPNNGVQGMTIQISNLSGTDFAPGAKVYFTKKGRGSLNVTNVTVLSPERITCTVTIPAGATIGLWNITVKNSDNRSGTMINAFMVKAPVPPTVTDLTPGSGIRGTTVEITHLAGTGFVPDPKPAVQLVRNSYQISATNITVINPNRITCTFALSPYASLGSWDVRVTNADRQSGVKAGAFMMET